MCSWTSLQTCWRAYNATSYPLAKFTEGRGTDKRKIGKERECNKWRKEEQEGKERKEREGRE